jgi:hypothetical protein
VRGADKPVGGARIVDPHDPARTLVTNRDGTCLVADHVADQVFVLAPGYAPTWVNFDGTPIEGTRARVVNLNRGIRLQARLAEQAPVGARVLVAIPRTDKHGIEWSTPLGKGGEIDVRVPPHVLVALFVELAGRFVPVYSGIPTADRDLGLRRLRPERHVSGRVLAADKSPVAGARVALRRVADTSVKEPARYTYTDRAGRFRFGAPGDGPHTLVAGHGSHGQVHIRQAADEVGDPVTLRFAAGDSVLGQVLRPDGKPAAGAWVTMYHPASSGSVFLPAPRSTMSALCVMADAEGRFRFGGLAGRQRYTIIAALLHEGSHCNATGTASAGDDKLVLRTRIVNR